MKALGSDRTSHPNIPPAGASRMMDIITALTPVVVVGAAVIYGVVKLVRSDEAGLRSRVEPVEEPPERTTSPGPDNQSNS